MCGIAAIIGKQQQDKDQIKTMLQKIAHRGEEEHFNESKDLGFAAIGMNRLAIVDRDNAAQPVSTNDDRYHIVFNGEIYNYQDLKRELIDLGCRFNTDSDTEVLANGYAAWGSDMLLKLRGMFAFIIVDTKIKSFFAARDPFGVKPLYWAKDDDNNYYLASEIKSLSFLDQIDEINLVPPGSYMADRKITKYWAIPTKVDNKIDENQAVIKIRELFDQAIKRRVQTDLPVAVYLSGGIDSTTVLATARKYHPNVTAIIVGSEGSSDRSAAVRYCEENDIPHVVKTPPSEDDLILNIPEIIRITESFEPNMIRQSSVSYYIAQAAAENGFKVILCGEGADETFAGYPEFTLIGSEQEVEEKIRQFCADLHRTQLQRVDRTSMAFTTEVREPFLDLDLAEYVLKLPASLKIRKIDGKVITKYILRRAMEDRLPEYIYNRDKVVLSEGAGYKGNQKVGGMFYEQISALVSDGELKQFQKQYPEWNLETKEEVYYFKIYLDYGYGKAKFNQLRTSVNQTNTISEDGKTAENIVGKFNTWRYKREQPKNIDLMVKVVTQKVADNQPIQFVMYWGKGERNYFSKPEADALKYVRGMMQEIDELYHFGTKLTLILTDTHAELNGYGKKNIDRYFNEVTYSAREHGFDTVRMSALIDFDLERDLQLAKDARIDKQLEQIILGSSKKHFKRSDNYQLGARLYYVQNQLEKEAVVGKFSDAIFLTYNSSELDDLLPSKMPIFYMHSINESTSAKPWFIN